MMNTQYKKTLEQIPEFQSYAEQLHQLTRFWDSISTVGAINQDMLKGQGGPLLRSMKTTRDEFTQLQGQLLSSLVDETVSKVQSELSFYAQNNIDILIRNLFERTADVGFLATDTSVREFLSQESDDLGRSAMSQRLRAYTRKYSVYDEIILLDRQGQIAAQLDAVGNRATADLSMPERIANADGYLEYFGPTSLYPNRTDSHIFASKVYAADDSEEVIGYLVMFFRLADELERIYDSMLSPDDEVTLLLLDGDRVIASSDTSLQKYGDIVDSHDGTVAMPIQIRNKAYLSNTLGTQGYQGYEGLGWRVRTLVPLKGALSVKHHQDKSKAVSDEYLSKLVLSENLKQINTESTRINRKLGIVTLNGKSLAVRLEARTFMPVLEKIKEVGEEINSVITDSISQLNLTAFHSALSNCRLYSSLAIDIMDRNLYERANDCRWWAMMPEIAAHVQVMAEQIDNQHSRKRITNILQYINELYTVYTNLIVFDKEGRVMACSNPDFELSLVGQRLTDTSFVNSTLMINDEQKYAVSQFKDTVLYDGKHTYLYGAAIRAKQGGVVGGIAVVFDALPEFEDMLKAALPRDGEGEPLANAGGLYVGRDGIVISSTDPHFAVGSKLDLPTEMLRLKAGKSYEGILELAGMPMLVGATLSSGYREYKTTGDYHNDVISIIFLKVADND